MRKWIRQEVGGDNWEVTATSNLYLREQEFKALNQFLEMPFTEIEMTLAKGNEGYIDYRVRGGILSTPAQALEQIEEFDRHIDTELHTLRKFHRAFKILLGSN